MMATPCPPIASGESGNSMIVGEGSASSPASGYGRFLLELTRQGLGDRARDANRAPTPQSSARSQEASTACAAASRAIGTRNGEHET